ncbi:hypothetical protein ScPMuIL_010126 [Solemya velum]
MGVVILKWHVLHSRGIPLNLGYRVLPEGHSTHTQTAVDVWEKMKSEWFVAILICSLCFNLAPADRTDCVEIRRTCLRNCFFNDYPGCRETCITQYEMCLRQIKKGNGASSSKSRREYRRTNPRGAVIQFILREVKELVRRF